MVRKTAVITGAANGIGRATAIRLARENYRIAIIDIDAINAEDSVHLIDEFGGEAISITTDLREPKQIERATKQLRDTGHEVAAVVNNAGVNSYADPISADVATWERVLDVDLRAAWLLVRSLTEDLARFNGAVVNVSSIHARLTTPGMFPYAVAKSGLEGLTRSLAVDLAARGIRVNAVAPGWTQTRLVDEWAAHQPQSAYSQLLAAHPLKRIATPEDIAEAIEFLLSPRAQAITGVTLPVDCGLTSIFRV